MNIRPIIAIASLVSAISLPSQERASLSADSTASIVVAINNSGNIMVSQPAALDSLLHHNAVSAPEEDDAGVDKRISTNSRSGYRIQIFDDNNPRTAAAQAKARERQILSSFPQYKTYVTFNSPYWQVKVGDFRTRGEAEAVMAEIREVYPQYGAYLRIVRDRINIFD